MRTLVVRLDNAGDVLLCGPAVRAVAAGSSHVTVLAGPEGADAARLLPGVDDVLVWRAPWAGFDPPAVDRDEVSDLVARLTGYDRAVILTSFHQSPLPAALLLRLAGVGHIAAISEDYPGSLLDVRHRVDDDIPEPERALSLARAAGFDLPPGDDGRLAVRRPLPPVRDLGGRYVVVHPGVSVPARAWPEGHCARAVRDLAARGWRPVVTGGPGERALTARVAGDIGLDLGGRTTLAELAGVLEKASALVAGNTGPAHLAAAVGTPVVSLFAPVVPAVRWAPYGVRHVLLGDQDAPCRDTRARECPVPGHPCLTSVAPADVVAAVEEVTR
jgi:ADP-heptose:LPS heptosyltransferase